MNVLEYLDQKKESQPEKNKIFIHNFFMKGNEYPGWHMNNVSPSNPLHNAIIKQYVWINNENQHKAFKVDIVEAFSQIDASPIYHELLQKNNIPGRKESQTIFGVNSYVNDIDEVNYGLFQFGNIVIRLYSIGDTIIGCEKFIQHLYFELSDQNTNMKHIHNPIIHERMHAFFAKGRNISFKDEQDWTKVIIEGPGELKIIEGKPKFSLTQAGERYIDIYTITVDSKGTHNVMIFHVK